MCRNGGIVEVAQIPNVRDSALPSPTWWHYFVPRNAGLALRCLRLNTIS